MPTPEELAAQAANAEGTANQDPNVTPAQNAEGTPAPNNQGSEVDLPGDYGSPVTFEEIINDPEFSKDYRKMVDKEVSKAIASYKQNHDVNVDDLVKQKVNAAVSDVKFEATLNEQLRSAGVIDLAAYKAHLDLDVLKEDYDFDKNVINGLDELIEGSKNEVPYLFKQEHAQATGTTQTGFGGNKPEIKNLNDALKQKFNIKK